jgi:hypothetical protein
MAKENNESTRNGGWFNNWVQKNINIIDNEKEIIFKYENPKNAVFDMTDFPIVEMDASDD